ncbi:MAG TPA: HEAT repeat domain-containing protein, partial [Phycisphaerae bacterium]|nr:HEAT repeat domain-containing protein [Phycisphaerae bacterium]
MTASRSIFRILRASTGPAADSALLAALEHADAATAGAIVETLLTRKNRFGLYGLIARLHLLDESVRGSLAAHIDTLFSVLREAAQSRKEQIHLNAIETIRRGRAYRASYLLEGAIRDPSARVREAAAETLCHLARAILESSLRVDEPDELRGLSPEQVLARMQELESYAEDRRQFVGAVEAGLNLFEVHRHAGVVEAAMWLVDDLGPKFWAVATAPGSRVAQAALRILREGLTPRLVPFAIAALSYAQFRPHVAPALGQCTDSAVLSEWLRQSWRLLQPKVARAMTSLKELACLERRAADLLRLPADAQRLVGRWLLASGLPSECKVEALLRIVHRGEPETRRVAVWAATQWLDEAAVPLLRELATATEPELKRLAQFELARRRPSEYPLAELSGELPAAGDATVPAADPGDVTFKKYWAGFERLDDSQRLQLGRTLVSRSSASLTILGEKLADPDPAARVKAVSIVRLLSIAESFAEQLYRLAHDPSPEVRSAVMSALAALPGGVSRRILHAALVDQDPRVRANAVEAVDEAGEEDLVGLLLPMLGSPDNRVRANAVKALLRQGVRPAAEALIKMLLDPDRAQRISALWLVEQMSIFKVADRVSRMAACDEDSAVRLRAQKIIEHLGRQIA